MNKTFSFLTAAIFALTPAFFCGSCSSSDDAEETVVSSHKGQRLEITLSGDHDKFDYVLMFWANDREGKASEMATSDGSKAYSYWSLLSTDSTFNHAWASVDGFDKTVSASLTLSNAYNNTGTVTVKARVLNDGKTVIEQSRDITVDEGTEGASITFTPEYGFSNID